VSGSLRERIETLSAGDAEASPDAARLAVAELLAELSAGRVRAAEREGDAWVARPWVKMGILLAFRVGALAEASGLAGFSFFDKDTLPVKRLALDSGVRVVPGGTVAREGCYLAPGVTIMPPAYVNVGAYVDSGTMIDSHALVGSCAQVGRRVHISAGAQIGGVLEPVGEVPVVLEDEVLVGGNCGVYEGAILRERAVLAAGVVLTAGTPVYDVVRNAVYRRESGKPLEIPAGAVVVPGSRAMREGPGAAWGLALQTPVIVKYRDAKTDASAALEGALR
jgi:2,3,4,5-tetrahydropyridine-2,6-dicarboxylate N-succinyltransferase